MEVLLDKSVPFSGAHRKKQWEKGWNENLQSGNNTPKYFGKYPIARLNQRFVWADKDYEQKMLYTIVDKFAKKYLKDKQFVIEFGCGTGHNLWRVKSINPTCHIMGADWTQSSNEMVEAQGFDSLLFDYFKPLKLNKFVPKTGVFTVASLEQTGTNYKKFVNCLIKAKPDVVVNIEPMPEMLDGSNLLDYLSIQYMHKRKYLRGYPGYLEALEKKGKIKILEKGRTGIGSMFIDGYSYIIWKPC